MEYIEFQGKVVEGKYVALPLDIVLRIKGTKQVKVTMKWGEAAEGDIVEGSMEKGRMQLALEEYVVKYPADDVTLDDFRYVGILSEGLKGTYKDDVVDAIEAGYHEI